MTGVGTALETGNYLIIGRQHVHDLAFALVTPLQTEYDIDFFHLFSIKYLLQKTFFASKDTKKL